MKAFAFSRITAFFYLYSMISRQEIKQIRSLQQNKGRRELGLFVVEGLRSVEDIIRSPLQVKNLFVVDTNEDISPVISDWQKFRVISQKDMHSISAMTTPPGILAVVEIPAAKRFEGNENLIVLDGLKDPGNLGTIIRTAHWFGIKDIICSPECVDAYNPKVVQATMGSIGFVNIFEYNLPDFISANRQYLFAGLDMEGDSIHQEIKSKKSIALVVGSESHGLSDEISALTNLKLTIPPADHKNKPESLNASIAASIAIYRLFSAAGV